jgi:nitroreductase
MEVDKAILARATTKVLGDPNAPLPANGSMSEVLTELLELAGRAPFHYACHQLHREGDTDSIVPWRFYALNAERCRELLAWLNHKAIHSGKIGQLLAAADALVVATWLPDPGGDASQLFDPGMRNMEHIAAAGAAVQNLLLAATSRDLHSYWSSGGVLRGPELFEALHIPTTEIVLGTVFLSHKNSGEALSYVPGKLHDLRGGVKGFSKEIGQIG